MRPEQWEVFKRAARLEKLDKVPMALIIDSPWIPGYLGLNHMDYFLDPELWFQSNLKIHNEFPEIIFVPSWWMEYGMAAEPSVLGSKIKFWQDNTPSEYHTLYRLEDKGLLKSSMGGASKLRGGRRKRIFQVTNAGMAMLRSMKEARVELWSLVPQLKMSAS